VGFFGGQITPDLTLDVEIRVFEVNVGVGEGKVELAAKLVDAVSGRAVAARVFRAEVPGESEGPAATASLDHALGQVLSEIVRWGAHYI
jgi:cholesterol transport system auxiliary component